MTEAFDALGSEGKVPILPAASPALNKAEESRATTTSIKMIASLNIPSEGEESEDGTETATLSPRSSSNNPATFMASCRDNESQDDFNDDHCDKVGDGECG